jgi:hypothetical protein
VPVEGVETSKVLLATVASERSFVGVQGGVTLTVVGSSETFAADVADERSGKGGKKGWGGWFQSRGLEGERGSDEERERRAYRSSVWERR